MTFADQMRDHQERCQFYLLKLRLLARGEGGAELPWQAEAEVRDVTNAIIAEAEAAGRAVLAAMARGRRRSEAESFLWGRLSRLARAADDAAGAARGGDAAGLRRGIGRFNALTDAIWTVQHAMHVPVSAAPAVPAVRAAPAVPAVSAAPAVPAVLAAAPLAA